MQSALLSFALLLPLVSLLPLQAVARKKTVAVMNFQNNSDSKSLDYLETALPESISGMLSSSQEIRVVERRQLKKVLKEIELEQSGVIDTGAVSRAGKLSHADVLILGSFTGNAEKIDLTIKAVEVVSGVVLDSRAVSAPLATVLDQSGQATLAMAAMIGGGKIGFVTVTTNPPDAEVLIDGVVVGKSPVVDYRVSAGAHRLFIRKADFQEIESEFSVNAGEHNRVSEHLAQRRKSVQPFIGFGYQRLIPYGNSPLKGGNMFAGTFGVIFGRMAADFTLAITPSWDHSYTYDSPFGTLTQSRNYTVTAYMIGFSFEPFDNAQYVSPYAGVFGGYTRVSDFRLKGKDDDEERLATHELLQLGAKLGLEFLPKLKFSIFLEGRYHYFPLDVKRIVHSSQGVLGGFTSTNTEINLSAFSVGGGVRLQL